MKAVALGLTIAAIVIACAASKPQSSVPPVEPPRMASPHEQIEQLSARIAANKQSLGIGGAEPRVAAMAATACVRSERDVCKQECTLSDSICDDARKICELADTMPGDAWAKDKCDSARTSCAQATTTCCKCT